MEALEPAVAVDNPMLGTVARTILDNADTMIVLTDRNGTILYVNAAFTAVTGYSPAEAVGGTPRLLRSGIQDDAFYRDLWGTVLAGETWHGELVNRRKDGTLYTDEMTIVPVGGTEATHFVAIKRDISRRIQSLTSASPTGLAHAGPDGRLLYVNQRTEALFEMTFGDLIGYSWLDHFSARDRTVVLKAIRSAYADDLGADAPAAEWRVRLRNGRHIALRAGALTAEGGTRLGVVLALDDVSAEVEAFHRIAERERFVRGILDAIGDPTAVVDREGVIIDVNAAWLRAIDDYGGSASGLGIGTDYLAACARAAGAGCDDAARAAEGLIAVLSGADERFEMEYGGDTSGGQRWSLQRITPLPGFGAAVVIHTDITWRHEAEERLAYLAHHDTLTGLLNRSSLDQALCEAIARTRHGRGRAVLFIDLDRFKQANDEFGHATGDAILGEAAERLRNVVRSGDRVVRAGGDEFVVILADGGGPDDAGVVASRAEAALSAPYEMGPVVARLGASVGIAFARTDDTAATLLARADAAMYEIKQRHHS